MFLALYLDVLVSAMPAAGHSFRNPVERCHSISNLGLQGIGMMRQQMTPENERVMRNLNSTDEIRKAFQTHPNLEKSLEESLKSYKKINGRDVITLLAKR